MAISTPYQAPPQACPPSPPIDPLLLEDSAIGFQVQASPTPLPRHNLMVINNHMTPPLKGIEGPPPTAVKRPASALATADSLHVAQKVKIGEGGSRGRIRCSDFDGMYPAIVQLAVSHYQCILANFSIYPNESESRDWSGQAWNAACRANGVRMEYDEDAYKLVSRSRVGIICWLLTRMIDNTLCLKLTERTEKHHAPFG